MGLWGVGRAFSDRSFLKILIFSTDFGRFRGGEVNLPPPPRNRVKHHLYALNRLHQILGFIEPADVSGNCQQPLNSDSRSDDCSSDSENEKSNLVTFFKLGKG